MGLIKGKEPDIHTSWQVAVSLIYNIIVTVIMFISAAVCTVVAIAVGNYADELMESSGLEMSTGFVMALVAIVVILAVCTAWCVVFCVLCVKKRFVGEKFRKLTLIGQVPILFIGFFMIVIGVPSVGVIAIILYAIEIPLVLTAKWEKKEIPQAAETRPEEKPEDDTIFEENE